MQYEIIILELLSRIKKLEEDVEMIKNLQSSNEHAQSELSEENATRAEGATRYVRMTNDMIEKCYALGKRMSMGDNVPELADEIAAETGMNRNSAIMYIYAVNGMMRGEVYKRAISSKAMKKFLDNIYNEYGKRGLKKALRAVELHIEYRRSCGHTVDSIEEICDNYKRRL